MKFFDFLSLEAQQHNARAATSTAAARVQNLTNRLPDWVRDWLEVIVPGLHILLIVLVAWLLQRVLRRIVRRASLHYQLPDELVVPINGIVRWTIIASAALLVLERVGVSATVLWTAFTGFATVAAVAFFAAWSVLSNLFCALLIFTVRPYRLGDYIEVLDTAEKPGAKGRVIDINLLYTTLQDFEEAQGPAAHLQIPNALVFQRVVRRWPAGTRPPVWRPDAPAAIPAVAAPSEVPAPPQAQAQPQPQTPPSATPAAGAR